MFCQKCGNQLPEIAKFCNKCGTSVNGVILDKKIQIDTTTKNPIPASGGKRFLNYLIDIFAIFILYQIFSIIAPETYKFFFQHSFLFGYLTTIIYYLICESIWQKTLGKIVTKTKVVDKNGDAPEFITIVGRSLARCIPLEPLSFLGDLPVGWHDSLSKTYVVSNKYTADDVKRISFGKSVTLSTKEEKDILEYLISTFPKKNLNNTELDEIIIKKIKEVNYLNEDWQIHYAQNRINSAFRNQK